MESVALVKHYGDLDETLKKAISLLGSFGEIKSPVIIKPNLCTSVDETGVATTNVKLVEALIKLVLKEDKNLSIRIVESDSGSKFVDEAFEKLGYKSLMERLGNLGFDVSLINLSRSPCVKIKFDGFYFKNPELPKVLTEPKYFISVAVAKTHRLTLVTGVLKNLFGLLPRKDQTFYHPNINDVIIDLNRLIRPDLCIVDAIVGLEGVIHGRPRRVNTIIAGKKPVSVDATMARIMGFKPERIRHLVGAERYDLGKLYPKIVGESLKSATVKFKPPDHIEPTALID
ncbi:DUF362 domain-containing protein [Candidatus Bathyarchaeota archaeon]|nr:DUF362 domain-containing protein [Candidatus Bathyarchaeota archaeon]